MSNRKLTGCLTIILIAFALIGLALFGILKLRQMPGPFVTGGQLAIHFLDVGQGDSILIITPQRKSVLIDAGPPDGRNRVLEALREQSIDQIDLAVATHPHLDHIGEMRDVLSHIKVKQFLDSSFVQDATITYTKMLEEIRSRGIPLIAAKSGQEFELDSGVKLHVLGPSRPFIHGSRSDKNANSVILRLSYGNFAAYFSGDSELETEKRVLEEGAPLESQVYKVAHHGSRWASSEEMLRRIKPEVAIISCSADNEYGHPSQPLLDRLRKNNIQLYRTDLQGEIVVTSDGNSYNVRAAHEATEALWAGRRARIEDTDLAMDGRGEDGAQPRQKRKARRGE